MSKKRYTGRTSNGVHIAEQQQKRMKKDPKLRSLTKKVRTPKSMRAGDQQPYKVSISVSHFDDGNNPQFKKHYDEDDSLSADSDHHGLEEDSESGTEKEGLQSDDEPEERKKSSFAGTGRNTSKSHLKKKTGEYQPSSFKKHRSLHAEPKISTNKAPTPSSFRNRTRKNESTSPSKEMTILMGKRISKISSTQRKRAGPLRAYTDTLQAHLNASQQPNQNVFSMTNNDMENSQKKLLAASYA